MDQDKDYHLSFILLAVVKCSHQEQMTVLFTNKAVELLKFIRIFAQHPTTDTSSNNGHIFEVKSPFCFHTVSLVPS